jgi:hypothetical protein
MLGASIRAMGDDPAAHRDWWARGLAFVSALIAIGGVSVALVQAHTAQGQARTARDQARTARDQAQTAREALQNTISQQESTQARKVSAEVTGNSIVVTNAGTALLHFVTVYLTDNSGKPVAEYALDDPLPACTALSWTSDRIDIVTDYVVTFDDSNGITWAISTLDGKLSRAKDSLDAAYAMQSDWTEKSAKVASCS